MEKMQQLEIKHYTADEYRFSTEPYDYLLSLEGWQRASALDIIADNAKRDCKITNFKTLFKAYCAQAKQSDVLTNLNNTTAFTGQRLELDCAGYVANDYGITTSIGNITIPVCVHPILPTKRLTNIDTLVEKLEIGFRKGDKWKYVTVDKKIIASKTAIIALADVGIAVTSENASYLVKYLHDVENLNYDKIPAFNSVGRLGWIEEEGFAPYVENLEFDGDGNFKTYFDSVTEKGSYDKWVALGVAVRESSLYARIGLAASFASVLVKPLGCLPFFLHLWGGTEAGKSVCLMLAASVWANPEIGRFVHTFNSTAVGREKSAAFVNSMPLIMDELQIVSDKKQFDKDIYMLSEGAGRTRGNKNGGVDKTPTWANCIITSGEMPITTASSGGGAVNRIVEIECKEKIFTNPRAVADTVRENYGFAGKKFVEWLSNEDNVKYAKELFNDFRINFEHSEITEKQTMAMSLILTADTIIESLIFKDDKTLKIEEVTEFLKTRQEVSSNERALDYIYDFIAVNGLRFEEDVDDNKGEIWGTFDGDYICIIRNQFNKICVDGGFNPTAVLSWLKANNKIRVPKGKGFTLGKRIRNQIPHCVWLKKQTESFEIEEIDDFDEKCPF